MAHERSDKHMGSPFSSTVEEWYAHTILAHTLHWQVYANKFYPVCSFFYIRFSTETLNWIWWGEEISHIQKNTKFFHKSLSVSHPVTSQFASRITAVSMGYPISMWFVEVSITTSMHVTTCVWNHPVLHLLWISVLNELQTWGGGVQAQKRKPILMGLPMLYPK